MSKTKAALLFPGQGAQFIGMGKDLYDTYEEAKNIYDQANEVFGTDIKKICFEGPQDELKKTRYAQGAIYVTSLASLAVFRSLIQNESEEIACSAGLSLGEATALTAANAIGFKDGVYFVKNRGLFMDEASIECPGKMTAVLGLSLEETEAICEETGAEIGNLNCPGQVVISGRVDAVEAAQVKCQEKGAKRCIPLDVSGAFHSSCMNSASKKIENALKEISIQEPAFPVMSNLTAQTESDPVKIKQILVNQMNHRTLWEQSMRNMIDMGIKRFYEIGPGKVLKGLMRKIDPSATVVPLGSVAEFESLKEIVKS